MLWSVLSTRLPNTQEEQELLYRETLLVVPQKQVKEALKFQHERYGHVEAKKQVAFWRRRCFCKIEDEVPRLAQEV